MANKYKITPKYTIPTGVAGNYRKGYKQVEGVVVHASANPNASIDAEINYMTNNYKNAFTHAWAGHDKIIEISNTDYPCWGAGSVANKRFAQIETTEDKRLTKKQKLQVIDRAAYWTAVQLVYYKLPCKDASGGDGTVWGHTHVTKYLGGTTHTDPIAYFNSVGVSWSDFYKQVERYYNAYKKGASDKVKSLDGTQGTVKPSTNKPKPAPSKPNNSLYGAKLVKNEKAKYTVTVSNGIKVRNSPSTEAKHTGTLKKGQSINYDQVYEGNGYRWLAYTGSTGNRLYLPYRPLSGKNEQWGYFGNAPTNKPKPRAKTLHLPKTAKTWRVYRPNGPYTAGNEIHLLTPSAYGGISYQIKGNPAPDVYLIDTKVKGRVAIYAGKGTGAVIK